MYGIFPLWNLEILKNISGKCVVTRLGFQQHLQDLLFLHSHKTRKNIFVLVAAVLEPSQDLLFLCAIKGRKHHPYFLNCYSTGHGFSAEQAAKKQFFCKKKIYEVVLIPFAPHIFSSSAIFLLCHNLNAPETGLNRIVGTVLKQTRIPRAIPKCVAGMRNNKRKRSH